VSSPVRDLDVELALAGGCSSVGRALALQAWGQEFDSPQLHQFHPDAIKHRGS
jgi:hypothetical protein